jgi:hypothetical protein
MDRFATTKSSAHEKLSQGINVSGPAMTVSRAPDWFALWALKHKSNIGQVGSYFCPSESSAIASLLLTTEALT